MKMSHLALAVTLALLGPARPGLGQGAALDLDRKVEAALQAKLGSDARTIRAAAVKEEVVLTGEVAERSTQELAKEVALSVAGVKKVDNQVAARKERSLVDGKIKDEAADQKLELEVESKVKGELGAHYKDVSIEVVDGVALIRGTVPDAARHKLAVKAMAGVKGVRKVVDLLTVGK